MGFTKMIDMAKSPSDVKKELKSYPSVAAPDMSVPSYPYGLCLSLGEDELDKLEIEGDCSVGDIIHLCALARVTSCSESETEGPGGEKKRSRRIELQVTHLATENEDAENSAAARAEKRYGDDEGE